MSFSVDFIRKPSVRKWKNCTLLELDKGIKAKVK